MLQDNKSNAQKSGIMGEETRKIEDESDK